MNVILLLCVISMDLVAEESDYFNGVVVEKYEIVYGEWGNLVCDKPCVDRHVGVKVRLNDNSYILIISSIYERNCLEDLQINERIDVNISNDDFDYIGELNGNGVFKHNIIHPSANQSVKGRM